MILMSMLGFERDIGISRRPRKYQLMRWIFRYFLTLFANSSRKYKENKCVISVWNQMKTELLIFASLISPSKIILSYFVWEVIASMSGSVSSPDESPRSSSKILRCVSYVQLSLMLDILLEIFDEMHISFIELVTVLRINASYLLNGSAWTTKIKRRSRPGSSKDG